MSDSGDAKKYFNPANDKNSHGLVKKDAIYQGVNIATSRVAMPVFNDFSALNNFLFCQVAPFFLSLQQSQQRSGLVVVIGLKPDYGLKKRN